MFTSWSEILRTLLSWRQQRFGHLLFVPVALTLVVASLVGAELPSLWELGLRGVSAWLMVLALRLWDDLEDRERDAEEHPERVLTQVDSVRPYALVVAILISFAGLLTWLASGSVWLLWPGLVVALLAFYRLKGQTWPGGGFVVLLKYPVLVLVLGGSWQPVGLIAMAVVLAGVGLDEVIQNRPSATKKLTRGALLALTLVTLLLFNNPDIAELINALN